MSLISRIIDAVSMRIKILYELSAYLPELFSLKGHIFVMYGIPYRIRDNYNWGDDINKYIVEKLSGKKVIPYQCSLVKHIHYLCIGSLLQWHGNEYGIVWGSGLREALPVRPCKKILAVRGPLTRKELLKQGYECPEVYGDPALLLPKLYRPEITKKYKIGIIPHFTELFSNSISELLSNEIFHFIDIHNYGEYENFIDEICRCEYIISSSLHGCIVSDAYNIPNIWCQFSEYKAEGNGFKFLDYYQSVKKNIIKPYDIRNISDFSLLPDIINQIWSPNEIDLSELINCCPFLKIKL